MPAASILRIVALLAPLPLAGDPVRGTVKDITGASVPNALARLATAQGATAAQTEADAGGNFLLDAPPGRYTLSVQAAGFASLEEVIVVPTLVESLDLVVSVASISTNVTVSAQRGRAEQVSEAAPLVSVVELEEVQRGPLPTIGNLLEGEPGVLVQQTTYGQVSPFLRGLTGYQVLNLVDGVRFNNATFRSGPNQYLAFLEPSQAQRVEAMLGPASVQHGSDALGGTINVLTVDPAPGAPGGQVHGELHAFGSTADMSSGANGVLSISGERLAWLVGGSLRKHNDLRAGGGEDSHNVYRRLFGLTTSQVRDIMGSRLQDSGFSQTGIHTKLAWRPTVRDSFTGWYQRSGLDHVRAYNNLLGGLGRMQADFDPQQLNFFYVRYERLAWGPLVSLSGTFSLNSQTDGTVRQGLRVSDTITTDHSRVDAYGYAAQAVTRARWGQSIVFGGERYDEHIFSERLERNPSSGTVVHRRPLYPDDSRYTTSGVFVQDAVELLRSRLRIQAGVRLSGIEYQTREDATLGVAPSEQSFGDATFHSSLVWQATSVLALNVLVGRGFRAPNANDLGAVGLNDLGYEIPSADALDMGALLATSAGEGATSTGRELRKLGPERLWNYEAGLRLRTQRLYGRVQVFDVELRDPILRRTLLFPASAVPSSLGGIAVTPLPPTPAQRDQNVIAVSTAFDPRAVKAFVNDGQTRYYGTDALVEYRLASAWTLAANYSFLVGRDLDPNRPVRRLPPQMGQFKLRYIPARRWWAELRTRASGAQERLSGGDLDDERIGGSRSRRDIADFFNGSRVAPQIDAQGRFLPTGETLAEIQNRVLPQAANDTVRLPLYTRTPGWITFDLRAGYSLGENTTLNFALLNILDRTYRVHGSGIDASGINGFAGITYRF